MSKSDNIKTILMSALGHAAYDVVKKFMTTNYGKDANRINAFLNKLNSIKTVDDMKIQIQEDDYKNFLRCIDSSNPALAKALNFDDSENFVNKYSEGHILFASVAFSFARILDFGNEILERVFDDLEETVFDNSGKTEPLREIWRKQFSDLPDDPNTLSKRIEYLSTAIAPGIEPHFGQIPDYGLPREKLLEKYPSFVNKLLNEVVEPRGKLVAKGALQEMLDIWKKSPVQ